MDKFWLWLLRFAYKKLLIINSRIPDGVPGIRDSSSKCSGYEPREHKLSDWADCASDGHYLCKECCHLAEPKEEPEDWREITKIRFEEEAEILRKLKDTP